MPIYEYHCDDCGHDFSFRHQHMNEPFPACPECKSQKVKKVFSTFAAKTAPEGGCPQPDSCGAAAGGHHCCGPNCCCHH